MYRGPKPGGNAVPGAMTPHRYITPSTSQPHTTIITSNQQPSLAISVPNTQSLLGEAPTHVTIAHAPAEMHITPAGSGMGGANRMGDYRHAHRASGNDSSAQGHVMYATYGDQFRPYRDGGGAMNNQRQPMNALAPSDYSQHHHSQMTSVSGYEPAAHYQQPHYPQHHHQVHARAQPHPHHQHAGGAQHPYHQQSNSYHHQPQQQQLQRHSISGVSASPALPSQEQSSSSTAASVTATPVTTTSSSAGAAANANGGSGSANTATGGGGGSSASVHHPPRLTDMAINASHGHRGGGHESLPPRLTSHGNAGGYGHGGDGGGRDRETNYNSSVPPRHQSM